MTTRCAIYVRVSTVDQVANLSLETQRESCARYAAAQGWTVEAVFVEEGESAKTAARTEFEKLLAFCRSKRGAVQYVVVYDVSRFMRNATEHGVVRGILAGLGIQLRSPTQVLDESPGGKLVEHILAAVAQHQNDEKAERTIAGMKAALSRGRWPHVAPLGYRNARGADERPTLAVDETRAPAIRRAFELAAAGESQRAILRELRALGLRTAKGRPLSPQTLARVLRHPLYGGVVRSRAWGIEARSAFPALVDESTWHAAQASRRRQHPADEHKRAHPDFPLRHFVLCECGRPMTAYWANGRTTRVPYYECPGCRARCRRDKFEDAFIALLNDLRPDPRLLEALKATVLEKLKVRQNAAEASADALRRRSAAITEKRERLAEAYAIERAMDRPTYDAIMLRLDTERGEVELELARVQELRVDVVGLISYAIHVITHTGTLWREANPEQRRALQGFMLPAGLAWSKQNGFVRTQLKHFSIKELSGENGADSTVGVPRVLDFEPLRKLARLREVLPIAA